MFEKKLLVKPACLHALLVFKKSGNFHQYMLICKGRCDAK